MTGLPKEAFRLFEDGAPQRIDFFTAEDSPVTVGFLVDSSGSMREGRERVIAAATGFAGASNSTDELFALAFNEHVRPALPPPMPFTNDASVFRVALARAMGAQGRTAMYDAISNGLSYIAMGHHPRRVLVVVGDGGDNASTTTFDQVLRGAQGSNAAIYTVGIIDPLEREANRNLLKRLAEATGGQSFFPRDVDDVEDVPKGCRTTYEIATPLATPHPIQRATASFAESASSSTTLLGDHCACARVMAIGRALSRRGDKDPWAGVEGRGS